MILIALGLLFILMLFQHFRLEGFNPFQPDTRPDQYPDQTYMSELIIAAKFIQEEIDQTEDAKKKLHLADLLNLIQFI